MFDVHEVTYTPTDDGPELQTSLRIGEHLISSSRVPRALDELMPVLGRLMIRIEQVAFVRTEYGPEIRASMRMGDHAFVSSWAMGPDDADLHADFEDLLRLSGNALVRDLQDALTVSPSEAEAESRPDTVTELDDWRPDSVGANLAI